MLRITGNQMPNPMDLRVVGIISLVDVNITPFKIRSTYSNGYLNLWLP